MELSLGQFGSSCVWAGLCVVFKGQRGLRTLCCFGISRRGGRQKDSLAHTPSTRNAFTDTWPTREFQRVKPVLSGVREAMEHWQKAM